MGTEGFEMDLLTEISWEIELDLIGSDLIGSDG